MSIWGDEKSYEERRAERREEERQYHGDVTYEVWRNGGNTDRIDDDRVSQSRYDGLDADHTASRELRAQQPPQRSEEDLYYEQIEQQQFDEPFQC